MKVGVIIRYAHISGEIILYDMSTDCTRLRMRTDELNARPSYIHPYEGHEFRYIYACKNMKGLTC